MGTSFTLRGCVVGAPLQQLPDLRLLPSSIQAKVFLLCSLDAQAALAHTLSCFRPLWQECRAASAKDGKPEVSACAAWHDQQMHHSAQTLAQVCVRSQVMRQHIHRAPAVHGSSTLHCSIQAHITQRQLAYILQLPKRSVQLLGARLGGLVFSRAAWPDMNHQETNMGSSMFMSLRVSCRRQAALLSSDELEHLEHMFCNLPEAFCGWVAEWDDLWPACEPGWLCSTCPSAPAAMHWHIPDEKISFIVKADDLIM